MNNLITFCLLLAVLTSSYSQNVVTINNSSQPESSYSPQKLIEDVFLYGKCSKVENFSSQVSGKPNELETKSYGYFKKGNSNFPFKNGIIITNGSAYKGGNNYVTNGTNDDDPNRVSVVNDQKGDKDLENALGTDDTFDASFFKFSFIPTKNILSFRFILASEEYDGRKECLFADSFAFLLRERNNGSYKNMAVLPTGEPISVTTINNSDFCRANPQYFEGYNVKHTNYDGRTKILNAKANVTPGVEYEIKIVIADQRDYKWDSAIFLEAESFNFQADVNLGDDITIANGKAPCEGDAIKLDTNLPDNLNYVWFKDRTIIPGENKPSISITKSGEYTVEVSYGSYCKLKDTTIIEFIPEANTDALDLFNCDDGSGTRLFNLNENEDLIFKNVDKTLFTLNFYNSASDAYSNIKSINTPSNYTGKNNETIYFRAQYNGSSRACPVFGEFSLFVKGLLINPTPNIELCDDLLNDGHELFNLEQQNESILGDLASSNVIITYHKNIEEANANTTPLKSLYKNTTNPQDIFVRLQSKNDASCFTVSPRAVFQLIVKERDNPSFEINPECLGASITITGNSGGQLLFNPAPNDGSILTKINNNNWSITNSNPKKTYTLQYTTNGECKSTSTQSFSAHPLPYFNLEDIYILCNNINGSEVNTDGLIIDTGLNNNDYTFEWKIGNNTQVLSTNSSFTPTSTGTYSVLVTNKTTGCQRKNTTIVESSSPPQVHAEITTANFANKHTIFVKASNFETLSSFEFSLDNGPWKTSTYNDYTFKDVAPGIHKITVRDTNGCGEVTVELLVLGYPKFFTPNNDSYNDTWKIIGLDNFSKVKIYIFNRYGKLLKQLSPNSSGWDGTYNGSPLPSSDYWFKVDYTDTKNNTSHQFKGHFSLKR